MNTFSILLIFTSIFTLSFTTINSYKASVPFEHIVYQSEIIATGEISSVNKLSYEFKIKLQFKNLLNGCVTREEKNIK
jgi:hypothetical protein